MLEGAFLTFVWLFITLIAIAASESALGAVMATFVFLGIFIYFYGAYKDKKKKDH